MLPVAARLFAKLNRPEIILKITLQITAGHHELEIPSSDHNSLAFLVSHLPIVVV